MSESKPKLVTAQPAPVNDPRSLDKIIEELENIKSYFLDVQRSLQCNDLLREEYLLLVNNADGKPFTVSPVFQHEVVEPVKHNRERYELIKTKLEAYMSKKEIDEIEASVLQAITAGKGAIDDLKYFPAYQAIHAKKLVEYQSGLQQEIKSLNSRSFALRRAYKDRAGDYSLAYAFCTFGVVFMGLGLVGLLITGIVHAIDKIIESVRLSNINKQIKVVDQKITMQEYPMKKMLDNNAEFDLGTHVRQSFFNLSKTRYPQGKDVFAEKKATPERVNSCGNMGRLVV